MPRIPYPLTLLITLTAFQLTRAIHPGNDVRAEVCAAACHDAMHWEICAQENGCYGLEGGNHVMCMDNCLHQGVNCEFQCWDSFDSIMGSCAAQCPAEDEENQCRRNCFLREFEQA